MRRLGIYSLLALVAGAALWWASSNIDVRAVDAFYGIAQTPETEVNSNVPVEVRQVSVREGDQVDSGQVLLLVDRASAPARLADQPYLIEELRAEQALESQQLRAERTQLEAEYELDLAALRQNRLQLESELAYRRRLVTSVGGDTSSVSYRPLQDRIAALDAEMASLKTAFDRQKAEIQRQSSISGRPADARVRRLTAEQRFDASQSAVRLEIKAPSAGVVGNVHVKVGEHKSSFAPLLSYYEPNPTQVLSYIHEDKLLDASVGDSVWVSSLANPSYRARGIVTGLGSRIVEIPQRLRRMPEISTYGREVVVALPTGNPFLQQEKVALSFSDEAL